MKKSLSILLGFVLIFQLVIPGMALDYSILNDNEHTILKYKLSYLEGHGINISNFRNDVSGTINEIGQHVSIELGDYPEIDIFHSKFEQEISSFNIMIAIRGDLNKSEYLNRTRFYFETSKTTSGEALILEYNFIFNSIYIKYGGYEAVSNNVETKLLYHKSGGYNSNYTEFQILNIPATFLKENINLIKDCCLVLYAIDEHEEYFYLECIPHFTKIAMTNLYIIFFIILISIAIIIIIIKKHNEITSKKLKNPFRNIRNPFSSIKKYQTPEKKKSRKPHKKKPAYRRKR